MNAVLLTGASGFVGRALWTALRGRGFAVRAAMRPRSAVEFPPGAEGAEVVRTADIGPDTDWTAALRGCEAVVHLAARVHVVRETGGGPGDGYFRTNVEGTESLGRAAARAGVRRFVFLSSVKVNGEATRERALTESDRPAPADAYGASKAEAEERLKKIASETGMEVVILRPPLVYGPGVKANFRALMQAIARGVPLPLGAIDNRRSLLYLGNLVDAIRLCLVHPAAANRTFLVSDGEDLSTPDLVRRLGRALGTRPRLISIPVGWLKLAGGILGRRDALARLTDSLQIDSALIRRELGWTPPFTVDQGLAETALWFRSQAGSGLVGARGRA